MALRRRGEQFEITAARPRGYDRPWARAVAPDGDALPPSRSGATAPRRHPTHRRSRTGRLSFRASSLGGGTRVLISPEQSDQLALDAHPVGRKDPDLVGGVCWLECNRGAAATETLEGGFFVVDQRDHDVAGIRALRLLE